MPERHQDLARRKVMVKLLLALVLVLPMSSCGDGGTEDTSGSAQGSAQGSPTTPSSACASAAHPTPLAQVDLDGDGTPESVGYAPAQGDCPARFVATVAGHDLSANLSGDPSGALTVTSSETAAVALPDRQGEVLLVKAAHPRGGFQARLFGYSDGRFAELEAEGRPIFEFIATDVLTTPTAVTCAGDGFEVVQARPHQPIGVRAAWDIERTTYSVDGNTVTKGPTSEIADDIGDVDLQRHGSDLVNYPFFENCLAKR